MGRVGIGMQQAHRHRLGAAVHHGLNGAVNAGGVQRPQHLAAEVQPLAHLQPVLSLHQRRGLFVVEVVQPGSAVAPELQHVAETLGGDERGMGALLLDDSVGGDGEAVAHLGDRARFDAQLLHTGADAVQHGAAVIVGRAGDLAGENAPVAAEKHDVGEGAANVHADAEVRHKAFLK